MIFSPWWEKNEKNQDQIKLTNSPLQQSSMYHYEKVNLLSTIVPPPLWSGHHTFLLRKHNVGFISHLFSSFFNFYFLLSLFLTHPLNLLNYSPLFFLPAFTSPPAKVSAGRLVRRNAVKAGADRDPLGEDCGSNKSYLSEAKNIYF